MSERVAERGATRTCVDCGTKTDAWVHGWDGEYRCMTHAANGRWELLAHHCPTCTCVKTPAPA